MEILNLINPNEFKVYLLVLARISLVLFMLPVFSTKMFPALVKAGFAMVISMLLYSVVDIDPSLFPETAVETALLFLPEAMIGLTLGLCVRIFFGSVQLAGQIIGFQMGFSMINVVDPQSGANVSIMEQIAYWVALLIFLLLNGHHIMLLSLVESFELVPPGYFMFQRVMLVKVLQIGAEMFVLAIKIGAPVIAVLLFTSAAFGLTAKFSPQMNVMIVAFPLKIFVGLVLFGLSLDIILRVMREYIMDLKGLFLSLLFWAGGG
ncbi:MAG: flagellar biosynthetic protein FliR [Thermodesulfobacteriota bacterium]|nr:flagellar biosynthetic protein FliR [Thermodesulfobacteriota bacterium]